MPNSLQLTLYRQVLMGLADENFFSMHPEIFQTICQCMQYIMSIRYTNVLQNNAFAIHARLPLKTSMMKNRSESKRTRNNQPHLHLRHRRLVQMPGTSYRQAFAGASKLCRFVVATSKKREHQRDL